MREIKAKLRYFASTESSPGIDALVVIKSEDLQKVAKTHGVQIFLERVVGNNFTIVNGVPRENPSSLEEMTQTVVTVCSEIEEAFRKSVRDIIKMYRAPRFVMSLWGSTKEGKDIVMELADEDSGW